MNKFGFLRISAFSPVVAVGDVKTNLENIADCIKSDKNSDVLLFPELSLTGYTCGDLFAQQKIHDDVWKALEDLRGLAKTAANNRKVIVVGAPIQVRNSLYNCAVVLNRGDICGIVPKQFLPNYKEFYEARWFKAANSSEAKFVNDIPFGTDLLFTCNLLKVSIGVEICEDLWVPIPPSSFQAIGGANVLLNLSASNETVGKSEYRKNLVENQSGRCIAAYAYCSSGPTESTSDLVFGGHSIIAENGTILAESAKFVRESQVVTADVDIQKLNLERQKTNSFGDSTRFSKNSYIPIKVTLSDYTTEPLERQILDLKREVSPTPFIPSSNQQLSERCKEIFSIQTCGLSKRLESLRPDSKINIGISGGLDSTLALLVAIKACDAMGWPRKRIRGITMPGFGTTDRTKNNATNLMQKLGITTEEIDIRPACLQAFRDSGHKPFGLEVDAYENAAVFQQKLQSAVGKQDVTFENIQARLRTFYLMSKGFVLGTGDLSESALGWCTYNGDHMSMYNVNCSVPKTLVKFLVEYIARNEFDRDSEISKILLDIVATKISPELLPPAHDGGIAQDTQDLVGPYILHDFFLSHFIRTGATPEKILFLAQIAFKNIYTKEEIEKCIKIFYDRFFSMQFKRNCVPDGPKVGSVSLSPRGDWRMPSDAVQSFYKQS